MSSFILPFYIWLLVLCKIVQSKESPILVQTLCRHADRNIIQPYPTDPWSSLQYWPNGYGELTEVGREQHYLVGESLRHRYCNLVNNGVYSPNLIYVQATNVDRVLMSAEANLAGLFPAEKQHLCNQTSPCQRIPVNTVPSNDYILGHDLECPRLKKLSLEYMASPAYTSQFTRHSSLISYLRENSGANLTALTEIALLYDTLWVEQLKGKCLPQWAQKIMVPDNEFYKLAMFAYVISTPTTEMKMLNSGYLLKDILDRSTNKTQSTLSPDQSMHMYFAHDTTIANLLNSIGLFKKPYRQPPYASCLLFELYKGKTNGPYLKTFYRKSADDISLLKIPGCGTKCLLKNWYKIYKDILPTKSFNDACQ